MTQASDLMIVNDISMGGVGFGSITRHNIKVGDDLRLIFRLDDKNKTEIQARVNAKSIHDYDAGVQFYTPDLNKRVLGFYLMK